MSVVSLKICLALLFVDWSLTAAVDTTKADRDQAYAFAQRKEWDLAIKSYRKALAA